MASISTITVGLNSQPLAPAPVAGATPDSILVVNLDTENTVNLGSASSQLGLLLGPLASITLTAPVWAAAVTQPLQVGIAPGGSSYSPGSLTITGPVTVEITGPVEVEGSVSITGTPSVGISGTVEVEFPSAQSVSIDGPVTAEISGTPTFALESGSEIEITNATINTNATGVGGFILPGEVTSLLNVEVSIDAGFNEVETITGLSAYSSLDISFNALENSSTATGAAFCLVVELQWLDPNGIFLSLDVVNIWCQGSTAPFPSAFSAPCKGVSCVIQMFNQGTVGTIGAGTGGLVVTGSFRNISGLTFASDLTSLAPVTLGGVDFQGAGPDGGALSSGWLGTVSKSLAESSAVMAFLLNQYSGLAYGQFSITADLAKEATIVDLSQATVGNLVTGTGQAGVVQAFSNTIPLSLTPFPVVMPASACALVVQASTTAASTVTLSLAGMR
jgi:hypothetical protein